MSPFLGVDQRRFCTEDADVVPWLVSPNCRADVRGGAHLPVLPGFSLAAEAAGPHALPAGGAQGNSVSLQPKRVETLHVPFSL